VRFEWYPQKAEANLGTHGVSFAEAVTVLEDDFALTRRSRRRRRGAVRHAWPEQFANLLVVVYVYRRPDIIRVISAWKANKRQREVYEEGRS